MQLLGVGGGVLAGDHSLVVATVWLVIATAALAGATAVIALFAFLAKSQVLEQLKISNRQTKQTRNEQLHIRARATLQAIAEWRTLSEPLFLEMRERYANNRTVEKAVEEERDLAFNRLVRRILERVEHLALGVRMKAYDENIVYELARGWIENAWNTYYPYIKRRRGRGGHADDVRALRVASETPRRNDAAADRGPSAAGRAARPMDPARN